VPIEHGCRMGVCGSDPIRIIEGEENLSAMRSAERRTLERLRASDAIAGPARR
jgi:nitrite reductase (NADH) large subunit